MFPGLLQCQGTPLPPHFSSGMRQEKMSECNVVLLVSYIIRLNMSLFEVRSVDSFSKDLL